MGRYYYSKKEEADSLKKIQMWWLKKNKYLEKGCWKAGGIKWTNSWSGKESNISFYISLLEQEKYLQLVYTQTDYSSGEKQDFDYKVPIVTTPCYFGGVRYWFRCSFWSNGVYCGRRVGVLYLGGKYFACRYCYDLTYNSRNLSGIFKASGQVVSEPELERLRKEIKREYYAGKMTKRYKSYLKKERKAFLQLQTIAMGLGGVYKKNA